MDSRLYAKQREEQGSMKRETRNARIRRTTLGYEDHGILTCYLHMEWSGGGQGFGGYAMKGGNGYGANFIDRILKTVGVEAWEDLPGKHIRIDHEHTKIHRIGHIIEDKWFSPEDEREELGAATK
jgi:hypothetical protein